MHHVMWNAAHLMLAYLCVPALILLVVGILPLNRGGLPLNHKFGLLADGLVVLLPVQLLPSPQRALLIITPALGGTWRCSTDHIAVTTGYRTI